MAKLTDDQINFVLNLNASGLQKEITQSSAAIKKLTAENKFLTKELKEAEKFMNKTASSLQKLEKAGKQNTAEYKELQKTYAAAADEIAQYNVQIRNNNEQIDRNNNIQQAALTTLKNSEKTMNQLRKQASDLQKQLNNTSAAADPETYQRLKQELEETTDAMEELKSGGGGVMDILTDIPGPAGGVIASVQGIGTAFKALLGAGPLGVILIVLTALIAIFTAFKNIVNSSEEQTNKFNQILAPFKALWDGILNILQKVVGVVLDLWLGFSQLLGAIVSIIPGMDKYIQKSKEAVELEKAKQQLLKDERALLVLNAKTQNEVSELKAKVEMRDKYSAEERLKFMNEAIELERVQMEAAKKVADERYRIAVEEAKRTENTAEANDMLAQAKADLYAAETEYNEKTTEFITKQNEFRNEILAEQTAAAQAAIDKQRDAMQKFTEDIEKELQKRQIKIQMYNSRSLANEATKNLRLLSAEKELTVKLIKELASRYTKIQDATLKNEIKLQIIQKENDLIALQQEIDQTRIDNITQNYEKYVGVVENVYAAQKQILDENLASNKVTQEQYNISLMYLDEKLANDRLNINADYYQKLQEIDVFNIALKEEAVKNANELFIQADREASLKRLEIEQQAGAALIDFRQNYNVITEQQLRDAQLKALEETYQVRKEFLEKENLSTLELDIAYEQAKTNMILEFENSRFSLRQQLGVARWNEEYEMNMTNLRKLLEDEAITQEEYDKATFNAKMDRNKSFYDSFAGMASGAVQAIQQAEMDSVDAKYDAEIAAAGDNAEEVERLENEKAQAKLDIEKKYADVNFAIKVAEIVANTAVAIMQGYAQLGPIGGSIAAVLMAATGAAQIVSANAERQKVKNMTLSGAGTSSGSQERVVTGYEDGGYLPVTRAQDGKKFRAASRGKKRGYINSPSILVSENGQEFVASAASVNNPTIRPILDIIDSAQKQGISGRLNLSALTVRGYEDGGYTSAAGSQSQAVVVQQYETAIDRALLEEIKGLLKDLKENGVKAPIVLSELQAKMELVEQSNNYANKG